MTDPTTTPIPGRTRIPYRFEDRVAPPPNCHAAQDAFGKSRGWRESHASHGNLCLRWVVGKRCLSGYGGYGRCDGCKGMGRGSLLDHARMWVTGGGTRVIVAEPYDMGTEHQQESLARLRATADAFGLLVEEFPELSVWYPPYTSLLVVRPVVKPGWLDTTTGRFVEMAEGGGDA